VGTNSGGVTTYDVELTFDAAGSGVRSGMNATGEIEVASVNDTLYIPVEAIMTMNNQSYVMVADGGTTVLADAAAQNARGGQRGPGADRMAGPGMGGEAPDMSGVPRAAAAQQEEASGLLGMVKSGVMGVYAKVKAWLYEGVETDSAQQATGSLIKVETGLQNDDYVEILSGLNEGDVVLYTSTEESSFNMFGGMMGGMMGGGMMGGGRR
ncbi:MAG: hypothetical protein IJD60_04980, partial [Clostridia bacterium]|nr:hypothetical protein [Clostridia bacterium]